MKRLALGSLLAAIAIFFWGFMFWALFASIDMQESSQDELALQQALAEHLPKSGTYYIPSLDERSDEYAQRHRSGPIAMIFVKLEGAAPMNPVSMLAGFLHEAIFAFLIGLLLLMALPALASYRRRVLFVTFMGVTAAFWSDFAYPIWWSHPWGFHVMNAFYSVVAWLIAGLILARFVAPVSAVRVEAAATPVTP